MNLFSNAVTQEELLSDQIYPLCLQVFGTIGFPMARADSLFLPGISVLSMFTLWLWLQVTLLSESWPWSWILFPNFLWITSLFLCSFYFSFTSFFILDALSSFFLWNIVYPMLPWLCSFIASHGGFFKSSMLLSKCYHLLNGVCYSA
jgi:hypothetical protein